MRRLEKSLREYVKDRGIVLPDVKMEDIDDSEDL